MENVTFTIPFDGVLILTGIVLTLLVSLVTNRVTDGRTKAYLLAGLSALSQVVAAFTIAVNDGSVFDIGQAALRAIATFLVAIGTFHTLTAPTGLNDKLQNLNLNPFNRNGKHEATEPTSQPATVAEPAPYKDDSPAVG